MDDALEQPSALSERAPLGDSVAEEDDHSSDEGLDWTKLMPAAQRPVIPKRGEKEFEPRAGSGSNLQLHVLDRARSAMLETLKATRTTSSKTISYAIWHPNIARAEVTVTRGIHFASMGHSAPRSIIGENGISKIQKRLELLPEEAIYLIERGALFCWRSTDLDISQVSGVEELAGSPMSVQQAYSEMIGREDLSLEKFQVYAYLKRLGYVVTRAEPPSSFYPSPPNLLELNKSSSILQRVMTMFSPCTSWFSRIFSARLDWWKPFRFTTWGHHNKNYGSLFRSLRFMPAGHEQLLYSSDSRKVASAKAISPYKIFYNLYKPSTPFKKSSPPAPEFQIVVINARTTPMPTLQELTDLFEVLPEVAVPPPRQRRHLPGAPDNQQPASTEQTNASETPPALLAISNLTASRTQDTVPSSLLYKLFPWAFSLQPVGSETLVRKVNPFVALKAGKKTIIVAVVDAGSTSFFRFSQGAFTEWPMI